MLAISFLCVSHFKAYIWAALEADFVVVSRSDVATVLSFFEASGSLFGLGTDFFLRLSVFKNLLLEVLRIRLYEFIDLSIFLIQLFYLFLQ